MVEYHQQLNENVPTANTNKKKRKTVAVGRTADPNTIQLQIDYYCTLALSLSSMLRKPQTMFVTQITIKE